MAALTAPRVVGSLRATLKKVTYPLAAGATAYENGVACIDTSALGALKPGASGSATLIRIGLFTASVNNSAGGATVPVGVDLDEEIEVTWLDAAGAGTPTIANLFQQLYLASDHEVTTTAGGNSKAGIMWALGGVFGIGMNYPGAIGVGRPLGLF
jgi:hypothetical protein